jgi:hypothetical protein
MQRIDGVAFLLESGLDEAGDLSVVLDDEDSHRVPSCSSLMLPRFADGAAGFGGGTGFINKT